MKLVVDLQYFAPFTLFNTLIEFSYCAFDQYEEYRKMSFRNRCTLLGGNGPLHLSIPLEGGRSQKTIMKEVRIVNRENWQERHWKSIISCYNRSPWFEFYRDELEQIYSRKSDWLMDWNLICFEWVYDKMAMKIPWGLTAGKDQQFPENEYLDWRGRLMPASINKLYPDTPRYPQVFEDRFGFIPNLSVLDRLFCMGGLT